MGGRFKGPKTKRMPARTWAEIRADVRAGAINRVFLRSIYEVVSEKLHHSSGEAASEIEELAWLMTGNGAGGSKRMGLQEACSQALDLAEREWGEDYMKTHTLALEVSDDNARFEEGEKPLLKLWNIEGL